MTEEILVIGGTGFIGTHICNRLVQNGFNVTAGTPEKKESQYLDPEVDTELADITYHGSLNFEDYSIVINLAGLSPLFKPSGVTYQEIHVDGAKNIVEEAERTDLDYLIHMSAYGAERDAETEYLRTKGEGQQLVEGSNLETCVLRPSLVLGEGGEFETLLSRLRMLPVAVLPGNPVFQPIAVDDVVEIFTAAVENRKTGVFDIGGDEVLSMKSLVKRKYPRKPVVIAPSLLTRTGLKLADNLPLPFGMDQFRSLQMDNSLEENDAYDFIEDLKVISI